MVAAVAGGGVAIGRASVPLVPPPGTAVGALVLNGTGAGGVAMRATLGPAGSWVRLTASVTGIPPGERCRIVVVARNGSAGDRRVVGGVRDARRVGRTGRRRSRCRDVAAVVVQNEAGHEFVRAGRIDPLSAATATRWDARR